MPGDDLAILNASIQKMKWHNARHKTLAQNIANADTPGYRPQDIAAPDFKSMLGSSASKLPLRATGLQTTNPMHLTAGGGTGGVAQAKNARQTYETSPSDNSSILEEQLMKLNMNDVEQRVTSSVYQEAQRMLRQSTESK